MTLWRGFCVGDKEVLGSVPRPEEVLGRVPWPKEVLGGVPWPEEVPLFSPLELITKTQP